MSSTCSGPLPGPNLTGLALDEVFERLDRLHELRRDVPEVGTFSTFVIPNADPTPALHDDLEERGVTASDVLRSFIADELDPAEVSTGEANLELAAIE